MMNVAEKVKSARANWKKVSVPLALVAGMGLSGCEDAATVASRNISKAADNFEIERKVVFYNLISSHFFATVEGRCSIEVDRPKDKLDVICKHGPDDYRKHFLGLAANSTYFVLQMEPAKVSEYHTRITFNPQSFIPDVDFRGDAKELAQPTRPDTHGMPVTPAGKPVDGSASPAGTSGRLPEMPAARP